MESPEASYETALVEVDPEWMQFLTVDVQDILIRVESNKPPKKSWGPLTVTDFLRALNEWRAIAIKRGVKGFSQERDISSPFKIPTPKEGLPSPFPSPESNLIPRKYNLRLPTDRNEKLSFAELIRPPTRYVREWENASAQQRLNWQVAISEELLPKLQELIKNKKPLEDVENLKIQQQQLALRKQELEIEAKRTKIAAKEAQTNRIQANILAFREEQRALMKPRPNVPFEISTPPAIVAPISPIMRKHLEQAEQELLQQQRPQPTVLQVPQPQPEPELEPEEYDSEEMDQKSRFQLIDYTPGDRETANEGVNCIPEEKRAQSQFAQTTEAQQIIDNKPIQKEFTKRYANLSSKANKPRNEKGIYIKKPRDNFFPNELVVPNYESSPRELTYTVGEIRCAFAQLGIRCGRDVAIWVRKSLIKKLSIYQMSLVCLFFQKQRFKKAYYTAEEGGEEETGDGPEQAKRTHPRFTKRILSLLLFIMIRRDQKDQEADEYDSEEYEPMKDLEIASRSQAFLIGQNSDKYFGINYYKTHSDGRIEDRRPNPIIIGDTIFNDAFIPIEQLIFAYNK